MDDVSPALWDGQFSWVEDSSGNPRPRLVEGSWLCAPVMVESRTGYRFYLSINAVEGSGTLQLGISLDRNTEFSLASLECASDPGGWKLFAVDLATGRCQKGGTPAFLRISKTSIGTVLVRRIQFEKLLSLSHQRAQPQMVSIEPDSQKESSIARNERQLTEVEMDELEQQNWRSRSTVAKKDERGARCHSMDGSKSMIFVPVKVKQNSLYRCHIDLKCETGNGKLFCNFYTNRNFDFPHVALAGNPDNGSWGTYDVQIKTGNFPSNMPMVLRLWRSPGGTGSLLVRRIALELLPEGSIVEEPKLVASSPAVRLSPIETSDVQYPTPQPQSRARARNMGRLPGGAVRRGSNPAIPSSSFMRQVTNVLVVSDPGDEEILKNAFVENGLPCEGCSTDAVRIGLSNKVKNENRTWVHFQLGRKTSITVEDIEGLREVRPSTIITAWLQADWPVFDSALLPLLRSFDLALFESEAEVATWRGAGCFNAELWDPGALPVGNKQNDKAGVVVIVGEQPKEELVKALAPLGDRLLVFDANQPAKVALAVFSDCYPSRTLFGLMAAGIPVVAKRSMEAMTWCEDGVDLRFFDTPEECLAIVAALLSDSEAMGAIADEGASTASAHSCAKRVRELGIRIGCHEMAEQCFPRDRWSYVFNRVMCVMRSVPAQLLARSGDNDVDLVCVPFTSCRDLESKIARFNPDILHLHLEDEDDNLPWRDLVLDLRRRMPSMLITAWHPGQMVDKRMMDLRFLSDHLFVGDQTGLSAYHGASLLGVNLWEPGASPSDDPTAFRQAMFSFSRLVAEKRAVFLRAANGHPVDLTVFIGTWNRKSQLVRAVGAAISSIGPRSFEIIVNDAGSTDGTQEWLKSQAEKDNRIIPIFSGKRTSFTQAFNEALQIAKGRYICWLSDDIMSESSALADMCMLLDSSLPWDMGGFSVKNSWGFEYSVRRDSGFYLPTVGCMQTETIKKLNGFNMDYPHYAQDTDLDIRTMRVGGRILAFIDCHLLHECRNDELRRSNLARHGSNMNDAKHALAGWRPGEYSRFLYPTILIVPKDGSSMDSVMKVISSIRGQYSNSHMFVSGEASEALDVTGPNSFLRKIRTPSQFNEFDLVVEVAPEGNRLLKPADKADTPFVRALIGR